MLKSMTGYGRAEFDSDAFSISVEMKSVNSRYGEVSIRLPRFMYSLEDRIRKQILQGVNRGKLDVFINASYQAGDAITLKVDKSLVQAYHRALAEIGDAAGVPAAGVNGTQELMWLARTQDVINVREHCFDVEQVWPQITATVQQALDNLVTMRTAEGENIKTDFLMRAGLIEDKLHQVEERAPLVVSEYQEKLEQRLRDLLEKMGVNPDPERVLQEVAIFADRTAINEEIVRLKSHLQQFRLILQNGGTVGRKLDFLIQEFNREANTIGSKANDYTLAQLVVDMKAEIEKIREQVQNIE